jgi:hypothetical protein
VPRPPARARAAQRPPLPWPAHDRGSGRPLSPRPPNSDRKRRPAPLTAAGHPLTKTQYEALGWQAKLGRSTFPVPLVAFPFYLIWGSPGRAHSHYHPHSDLFSKHQRPMVVTSDVCLAAMYVALAGAMVAFGAGAVAKLYWCGRFRGFGAGGRGPVGTGPWGLQGPGPGPRPPEGGRLGPGWW